MRCRCSWSTRKNEAAAKSSSRCSTAALINSMCQNFWPMFIGSVCAAVAAVMTALKTGNVLLWPCVGPDHRHRHRPRLPDAQIRTAHLGPDVRAGQSIWSRAMPIGAMVYAAVLGIWCFLTIFGNDDAVAHMVCVAVTIGYTAGGAARNYGRPKLIPVSHRCWPADRCRWRWRCMATPYYIGLAAAAGAVLHRPEGHQPQPARHLRQGADVELPRSGAGRPVRYRAEQHAARAVHVPRRRPACGDESPLQRNDEPVRRSRAARRQRVRHHRGLRRRRTRSRRRAAR